jgi:hypothetical protein
LFISYNDLEKGIVLETQIFTKVKTQDVRSSDDNASALFLPPLACREPLLRSGFIFGGGSVVVVIVSSPRRVFVFCFSLFYFVLGCMHC